MPHRIQQLASRTYSFGTDYFGSASSSSSSSASSSSSSSNTTIIGAAGSSPKPLDPTQSLVCGDASPSSHSGSPGSPFAFLPGSLRASFSKGRRSLRTRSRCWSGQTASTILSSPKEAASPEDPAASTSATSTSTTAPQSSSGTQRRRSLFRERLALPVEFTNPFNATAASQVKEAQTELRRDSDTSSTSDLPATPEEWTEDFYQTSCGKQDLGPYPSSRTTTPPAFASGLATPTHLKDFSSLRISQESFRCRGLGVVPTQTTGSPFESPSTPVSPTAVRHNYDDYEEKATRDVVVGQDCPEWLLGLAAPLELAMPPHSRHSSSETVTSLPGSAARRMSSFTGLCEGSSTSTTAPPRARLDESEPVTFSTRPRRSRVTTSPGIPTYLCRPEAQARSLSLAEGCLPTGKRSGSATATHETLSQMMLRVSFSSPSDAVATTASATSPPSDNSSHQLVLPTCSTVQELKTQLARLVKDTEGGSLPSPDDLIVTLKSQEPLPMTSRSPSMTLASPHIMGSISESDNTTNAESASPLLPSAPRLQSTTWAPSRFRSISISNHSHPSPTLSAGTRFASSYTSSRKASLPGATSPLTSSYAALRRPSLNASVPRYSYREIDDGLDNTTETSIKKSIPSSTSSPLLSDDGPISTSFLSPTSSSSCPSAISDRPSSIASSTKTNTSYWPSPSSPNMKVATSMSPGMTLFDQGLREGSELVVSVRKRSYPLF